MPRYRKKPVVIDAVQWVGNMQAVVAWLEGLGYRSMLSGQPDDDIEHAVLAPAASRSSTGMPRSA